MSVVRFAKRASTLLAGYSTDCHVSLRRNELNEEINFRIHLYLTSVSIRRCDEEAERTVKDNFCKGEMYGEL
jgi:hypothetical protein